MNWSRGAGEIWFDLVAASIASVAGRIEGVKCRSAIALDPATWKYARGWAIWKAVITLVQLRDTNPVEAKKARQVS